MKLELAKGESVVKSWDYAKAGHRFDHNKKECNLTVTNKRIISTIENKFSLERQEFSVFSVKWFSGSYERNSSFLAKLKLIISIPLCLILIGIPLLIKAIKELRSCVFNLTIATKDIEGSSLAIGARAAANNVKRRHFFKAINKFVVTVDKPIARDILDTIGGIVLNVQEK